MKTFSLKLRFAILMSIGALALVVGMGVISMRFAEDDLLATLAAQQQGIATRTAEALDEHLRFAADSLALAAAAIPPEVVADRARFDLFHRQHPALLELFDSLFVIDANGIVQAAYPNKQYQLIGLDLHDRSYFLRALASGKPVVSDPMRGRATGTPIVDIAIPIVDADGKVTAVMVGALTLGRRNFLGSLAATRLGDTGYFVVATTGPEPMYLVHPDAAQVMQHLSPDHAHALRTIVAADRGVALTKLEDGSEALVASRPLTMTNWVLVAVLPRAEAFVAIDHARKRTIEAGFVVAVFVLPLTWLLAWFLLKPLTRLRDEVESAASNPDPANLATSGRRDEVGEVALAFDALLSAQRASDALRIASDQDRRRLVAILESSGDFVAMADVSGNLTYLNASARRCCGIGLDDDLSRTSVRDCFPPWAIARLEKEGVPAALANGIWMGETAILDADGNEVPVDQTVIAHRNVAGKLEFFSSLLHDTSAAKAASAAMRSSEARMLSISDALPVMVAFVDRDWRYRFVNFALRRPLRGRQDPPARQVHSRDDRREGLRGLSSVLRTRVVRRGAGLRDRESCRHASAALPGQAAAAVSTISIASPASTSSIRT